MKVIFLFILILVAAGIYVMQPSLTAYETCIEKSEAEFISSLKSNQNRLDQEYFCENNVRIFNQLNACFETASIKNVFASLARYYPPVQAQLVNRISSHASVCAEYAIPDFY